MVSVPVEAGTAGASAAGAVADAAAGAALSAALGSAGLSPGVQPTKRIAVSAIASDSAFIEKLPSLRGAHYCKDSRAANRELQQLVGFQIALEIAVGVVSAGVLDEVARGAQPILRARDELGGGARQVFLRDLPLEASFQVLGEHVFLGSFHQRVDVGAGEL